MWLATDQLIAMAGAAALGAGLLYALHAHAADSARTPTLDMAQQVSLEAGAAHLRDAAVPGPAQAEPADLPRQYAGQDPRRREDKRESRRNGRVRFPSPALCLAVANVKITVTT